MMIISDHINFSCISFVDAKCSLEWGKNTVEGAEVQSYELGYNGLGRKFEVGFHNVAVF